MELNWSTLLLEIINFLILVWILKHFLYRPVLAVIAKRRAGIEEELRQAQQREDEAQALKAQYKDRMTDWEQERQTARDALADELEQERARQLQQLHKELEQEREKARVTEQRRRNEAIRETEHQALLHSTTFANRLLSQAAGPELHQRLLELLLQDLATLSEEQLNAIKSSWGEPPQRIDIASAFALSDDQQQRLQQAISNATGLDVPLHYAQQSDLIAGLQITIGAWVLQLNVRDELKGFAEFARATRD